MRKAYFDCSAGVSGNMLVGAMLNLGLPPEYLMSQLQKLPVNLPEISFNPVKRQGIQATFFEVAERHEHHHRHLEDILAVIREARLESLIASNAEKCFSILAEAEAKIHGVPVDEIHFHEVGALDAIVDIVGACIGMAYFKIDKSTVSPIRVGFGTVTCAHGIIPVPAPATMELLSGYKIYGGEIEGEWATPTGAAILRVFASECGPLPAMTVTHVGYGAGSHDRAIPNVLRMVIGDSSETFSEEEDQVVIETNIDDMNPELFSHLGELLLSAGAKDYYLTPVQMKKNRPGILITVVVPQKNSSQIENVLLTETTTIGIRKYMVQRRCLQRSLLPVEVAGREVKVKTAWQNDKLVNYAPEYEDCRKVAAELAIPVKEVYDEARSQARKILKKGGAC
jgi:TIGR00299 family protein